MTHPAPGHLLVRDGDSADLYDLESPERMLDLVERCKRQYMAGEPLGEVFYVGPTWTAILDVEVQSSLTPYDDEDFATRTVSFVTWVGPTPEPETVATVKHPVDGRA